MKKEVIDFNEEGRLFQSDGALNLNDLRPNSLWIFGTMKNGLVKCLRGYWYEMYMGPEAVLSMVEHVNGYI